MKVKHISNELAMKILQTSSLDSRDMCTVLEAVYINEDDPLPCPGVYKIEGGQVGNKSMWGKVYQATCDGIPDKIAKWQSNVVKGMEEAKIQDEVAKLGMAPEVREVWKCDKGVIIIMDPLKISLKQQLQELTLEQLGKTIEHYKKIYGEKIEELSDHKVDVSGVTEDLEEGLRSFDDLKRMRVFINRLCWETNLEVKPIDDNPTIQISDSPEKRAKRENMIKQVIGIMKNIGGELNLCHGDTHLENFMNGFDGKYYLIDFGEASRPKDVNRDMAFFRKHLVKLIDEDGYKNLSYLKKLVGVPIGKDFFPSPPQSPID
jgi:hypothetical protein